MLENQTVKPIFKSCDLLWHLIGWMVFYTDSLAVVFTAVAKEEKIKFHLPSRTTPAPEKLLCCYHTLPEEEIEYCKKEQTTLHI